MKIRLEDLTIDEIRRTPVADLIGSYARIWSTLNSTCEMAGPIPHLGRLLRRGNRIADSGLAEPEEEQELAAFTPKNNCRRGLTSRYGIPRSE